MGYSTSKQLISNVKPFLTIMYFGFLRKVKYSSGVFYGWGRKKSGHNAIMLAKKYDTQFILLEDGFIRSLGLGVEGSPSFSLIKDNIGIYYDASEPSQLENLLNTYDFQSNHLLMEQAKEAIKLIHY